jgi:hypothetical protein
MSHNTSNLLNISDISHQAYNILPKYVQSLTNLTSHVRNFTSIHANANSTVDIELSENIESAILSVVTNHNNLAYQITNIRKGVSDYMQEVRVNDTSLDKALCLRELQTSKNLLSQATIVVNEAKQQYKTLASSDIDSEISATKQLFNAISALKFHNATHDTTVHKCSAYITEIEENLPQQLSSDNSNEESVYSDISTQGEILQAVETGIENNSTNNDA